MQALRANSRVSQVANQVFRKNHRFSFVRQAGAQARVRQTVRRQSRISKGRPESGEIEEEDGTQAVQIGDELIASGRVEKSPTKKLVNTAVRFTKYSVSVCRPGQNIEPVVKQKFVTFVETFCKFAFFRFGEG